MLFDLGVQLVERPVRDADKLIDSAAAEKALILEEHPDDVEG